MSDLRREETQSRMAVIEHSRHHQYDMTEAATEHLYNMTEIEEQNESREDDDDG